MENPDERTPASGLGPPAFSSMFSRPAATLDSLRESPRWFCPLLVAAGFAAAVNFYVIWRTGLGRLVNAALQASTSVDPQAVLESAMAHRTMILISQGLASFAGTFVTAFVVAKVLWLIVTVIGKDLQFKKVLAVVAHVTMLTVVIRQLMLALTATVMPDLDNFDVRNPLATNFAFFIHPKSPVVLRLLSSFDIITFANILLISLGLARVSNCLSFRTACILVIVPWGVYTGASLFLPAGF